MMKKIVLLVFCLGFVFSATAQQAHSAEVQKPETFKMEWGGTTRVMQKYFVVFLKSGPKRNQNKEKAAEIQKQHLDYLSRLYETGKTSLTGPLEGDGDIRGIVVYNTVTLEEAKRLAEGDPAVKAGRLVVEVHPWWAAKGSVLN